MIYNLKINDTVSNEDFDTLMENTENRFEYETISEAIAICISEQEINWKNFMKAVGLSELSTVMEGQEVIYEGKRLDDFLAGAKKFFEKALEKLGAITAKFVKAVKERIGPVTTFLKKHGDELSKSTKTIKMKGHEFNTEALKNVGGTYSLAGVQSVNANNAKDIINNKDTDYTKKAAQEDVCPKASKDKAFAIAVKDYLFGENKEMEFTVSDQVKILKDTPSLKDDAKKSYDKASKEIKTIISNIKKMKGNDSKDISDAAGILIGYWKSYSNALFIYHGNVMNALSVRNLQAFSVCRKAVKESKKESKSTAKEEKKATNEGFISTDAFLGAVEFF